MIEVDSALAVCLLGVVQGAGLLSAWLARLSERSSRQAACQYLFLTLLGLVAAATLWAATWGPGPCVISGTTLAVMSLTATCDLGGGRHALGSSPLRRTSGAGTY